MGRVRQHTIGKLVRQELSTTPSAGSVASERAQWRWVSPRDEPRSAKRYGRGFGRFVEVACHEGWGVKKASFDQLVNSWWAAASVSASVPSRAPSASPYRAEPASTRVVGRHGRKCTRGRRVDDVVRNIHLFGSQPGRATHSHTSPHSPRRCDFAHGAHAMQHRATRREGCSFRSRSRRVVRQWVCRSGMSTKSVDVLQCKSLDVLR